MAVCLEVCIYIYICTVHGCVSIGMYIYGSLFVTYRRPNCWTKWAEIWHGGRAWTMGRFVGGCDLSPLPPVGAAGKVHKNVFSGYVIK